MKEIHSKRYGTNPKEGVHKWLGNYLTNYKRGSSDRYFKGFAKYLDPLSNKQDNIKLAVDNFKKFTQFIISNNPK